MDEAKGRVTHIPGVFIRETQKRSHSCWHSSSESAATAVQRRGYRTVECSNHCSDCFCPKSDFMMFGMIFKKSVILVSINSICQEASGSKNQRYDLISFTITILIIEVYISSHIHFGVLLFEVFLGSHSYSFWGFAILLKLDRFEGLKPIITGLGSLRHL